MRHVLILALGASCLVVGGCGEENGDGAPSPPDPAAERRDRAAKPPPGWGTVRNRAAGFTIAAPGGWTARTRGAATLIRSPDRLAAITVTADRSGDGVRLPPRAYARQTMSELPGFRGRIAPGARRIARSPYRTALVSARGRVRKSAQRQLISVAVYRRPRQVTYALLAFRNAGRRSPANEAALRRMLPTLRGQPPDNTR